MGLANLLRINSILQSSQSSSDDVKNRPREEDSYAFGSDMTINLILVSSIPWSNFRSVNHSTFNVKEIYFEPYTKQELVSILSKWRPDEPSFPDFIGLIYDLFSHATVSLSELSYISIALYSMCQTQLNSPQSAGLDIDKLSKSVFTASDCLTLLQPILKQGLLDAILTRKFELPVMLTKDGEFREPTLFQAWSRFLSDSVIQIT
jgi:hypothetical protein